MNIGAMCNGLLCGLVGITGGCNVFDPIGAAFTGIISGLVY